MSRHGNYASAVVMTLALLMVALVGLGAKAAFDRLTAALAASSQRTEQLLRVPTTPSPLDRVRADLTQ